MDGSAKGRAHPAGECWRGQGAAALGHAARSVVAWGVGAPLGRSTPLRPLSRIAYEAHCSRPQRDGPLAPLAPAFICGRPAT